MPFKIVEEEKAENKCGPWFPQNNAMDYDHDRFLETMDVVSVAFAKTLGEIFPAKKPKSK